MSTPLRVLVIDRSAAAALDIVQALQRSGYPLTFEQVTAAENVQAALAKQSWDLVICDESYVQVCGAYRALASLYSLGHEFSATLEISAVLSNLVRQALNLLRARESYIYLPEPGGRTLRMVRAADGDDQVVEMSGVSFDVGIVRDVTQHGRGVLIAAGGDDPPSLPPGGLAVPGTLISVPLIGDGQVTGVFLLSRHIGDPSFTITDLDILTILASYAATAIQNARLFRAAQQRAVELERALEHQKALEHEKDQFVQEISHELRTPIAIARGYAELLDGGLLGQLTPEQQEPAAIVARRLRMLTSLVNDINSLYEIESQKASVAPVDLTALVREAVVDFGMAAQKAGVGLEGHVADQSLCILGDAIHLRRVLDNLLNNALKFTPAGGTITVVLRAEDAWAVVCVVDSGLGIPADKLSHIFERFYQIEDTISRRHGGLGLGLALVKQIVEVHQGTVEVISQLGQGSTFTVRLPIITGGCDG